MDYIFKSGARISSKINAQVVGERLAELSHRDGGLLREAVVEDARPDDSPLHDHFTWDDSEAADKWRLEEAGYLIRSVEMVPQDTKVPARAFVSVNLEALDHPIYLPTVEALTEEELRNQVLRDALTLLTHARARYGHLKQLAKVFAAIDEAAEAIAA